MKRYYIKKNKLDEAHNFFSLDDIDMEEDPVNPAQAQADKVNNAPLVKVFRVIWDFLDKGSAEDPNFDPDKVMIYMHRGDAELRGNFFFSTDSDVMNHYYKYSSEGPYDMNILNRAYMPGYSIIHNSPYSSLSIDELNKNIDWKDTVSKYESKKATSPFSELNVTDNNANSDWLLINGLNLVQEIWQKMNEILNNGQRKALNILSLGYIIFAFPYLTKNAVSGNKINIAVPNDMNYIIRRNNQNYRLGYMLTPEILLDNQLCFSRDFYVTDISFICSTDNRDLYNQSNIIKCLPKIFNNTGKLAICVKDYDTSSLDDRNNLADKLKNDLNNLNRQSIYNRWYYSGYFMDNSKNDKGKHVFLYDADDFYNDLDDISSFNNYKKVLSKLNR